ncbi:gephyrin-like molybdotransferase receptor GlpR [Nocardia sp. NPDC049220]|uniref:divisome protein SepX/GlpR n=1 Tax=Nocardia sp. NPDC049220 TaxID=3155273 RepID=UPI0033E29B67
MPNSILWIGLVVLWVFVLFPILADRHPRIRRTTDAALATRVLHRGGGKRRLRKGPAAGHETDPNWRPRRVPRKYSHSDDAEDRMTTPADESVTEADEEDVTVAAEAARSGIADAESDNVELTEVDLDTGESDDDELADRAFRAGESDDRDFLGAESDDEGADLGRDIPTPDDGESADHYGESEDYEAAEVAAWNDPAADDGGVGESHFEPAAARIPPVWSAAPARLDDFEYDEYDEHDENLWYEPEFVPSRRGRGGFDPEADAIARAARYGFRQRAVLGLVLAALLGGALAVVFNALLWWACGLATVVLVGYLAYLRKQVRMEEEIRRRRAARLTRGQQHGEAGNRQRRAGVPEPHSSMDRDTARALRRRSVLVEPDDEDPMFDHLDPFDPATARALRTRTGRDIRRAAGA